MPKRKRFTELVKELGNDKIKRIALDRAYTQGMTLEMLAKKYGLKSEHIRKILKYAIEHPTLITDNEAHLIAQRSSLNQYPHTKEVETFSTKNYYVGLMATRAQNQRALRETEEKKLLDKIAERESLLASYDDVMSSDEEQELSREDLKEQIKELKKLLEEKG